MSISVGSNTTSLLNYAGNAYGPAGTGPSKTVSATADNAGASLPASSTSVTLSENAKAYLARTAATGDDSVSTATLTANARAWFNQQYAALGTSSAMLDGQIAVDLSGQSRATLSVVAANAQSQFSKDEATAAATTLRGRFDDAMAHHVVIARHIGDYASLYAAASDYLDLAGTAERATSTWQKQRQAATEGLAAAKASFGKAPDTGNDDDPVRALLDRAAVPTSVAAGSSPDKLSAHARAIFDAQAGNARDNGKDLVFNGNRATGQQADFAAFDNRTLAIVALNRDASFSSAEAAAAKAELNQRTRGALLNAFNSSSGSSTKASTVALLRQYSAMSDEEKNVLGFNDQFANRIVANYRASSAVQSSLGSSAGLAAYL